MGLDMYAYRTRQELDTPVDFGLPDESEQLFYWRKHPDLHGWMRGLYRKKGGTDPNFNSVPVRLTLEDIDELEDAVRTHHLPKTAGFFFGESCAEDYEADLEFIAKAREAIAKGFTVYYTSWW